MFGLGRKKQENSMPGPPIVDVARGMAAFVVSAEMDAFVDKFYRQLSRDSEFDLRPEKLARVRGEEQFLLIHIIDRFTSATLQPELSAKFMDALYSSVGDQISASTCRRIYSDSNPGWTKDEAEKRLKELERSPEFLKLAQGYKDSFREAFSYRSQEYSTYTFGPRVEGQPLKNDLGWEYGKKISDLLKPDGPWSTDIMSIDLHVVELAAIAASGLDRIRS